MAAGKNVVLILGAGASQPYGFLIGRGLHDHIIGVLREGERNWLFRILRENYAAGDIDAFAKELRLSGSTSVDAFLEDRNEWLALGKSAIAASLMSQELDDRLFPLARMNPDRDWYRYLLSLVRGREAEFREHSRLVVLTFNYDRSLEHFLFTSYKNRYNFSDDGCATAVHAIPILHLHGQLGYLPWEGFAPSRTRPYDPAMSPETLRAAVDGIRVIHEADVTGDPVFEQAFSYLNQADLIAFLGFGYHTTNIARLRLHKVRNDNVRVRGTALGLEAAEKEKAENHLQRLFAADAFTQRVSLLHDGYDVLMAFRTDSDLQELIGPPS